MQASKLLHIVVTAKTFPTKENLLSAIERLSYSDAMAGVKGVPIRLVKSDAVPRRAVYGH